MQLQSEIKLFFFCTGDPETKLFTDMFNQRKPSKPHFSDFEFYLEAKILMQWAIRGETVKGIEAQDNFEV